MRICTNLKDVKENKLYINDIVEFKRKNIKEKGIIIDKSHQFKGVYFIQCYNSKQLVLLNEQFIKKLEVKKCNAI